MFEVKESLFDPLSALVNWERWLALRWLIAILCLVGPKTLFILPKVGGWSKLDCAPVSQVAPVVANEYSTPASRASYHEFKSQWKPKKSLIFSFLSSSSFLFIFLFKFFDSSGATTSSKMCNKPPPPPTTTPCRQHVCVSTPTWKRAEFEQHFHFCEGGVQSGCFASKYIRSNLFSFSCSCYGDIQLGCVNS